MSQERPVRHVSGPYTMMVGGREGIRTPDPLLAKQVLSQLSYTPLSRPSMLKHFPERRILANMRCVTAS